LYSIQILWLAYTNGKSFILNKYNSLHEIQTSQEIKTPKRKTKLFANSID
jgi:hypothetical protein